MPTPDGKKCNRCKLLKPTESFPKRSWSKDGRGSTCHRCKGGKPPRDLVESKFTRPLSSQRYLITAAQNATEVHSEFFETLKIAAEYLKAELIVIPLRYKNPTSIWTEKQRGNEVWDHKLLPYLYDDRKKLGPNLVLVGDVKIVPTASSPLTGFEGLTGAESCIIGHTKMQYKVVSVPSGKFPKILSTTGACTKRNYTDSKAGAVGAFHHYLGAVLVELDGKKFHLRQINANRSDGSFIDLDKLYTTDGVKAAPPARGLILGDIHVHVTDPQVDKATYGEGGIVETLNPEKLVVHDLTDGVATNPHEIGNPFITAAKVSAGCLDVKVELQEAADFIKTRMKGRDVVLVDSNHHDFLSRWVIRTDWRQDLKNAAFYLETAQVMLASAKMTGSGPEYKDPFQYWMTRLCGANVKCLGPNDSFTIAGIECGLHGHRGPNGSRGSIKNLSCLGSKVISGHGHTPGIEGGHYRVGTSTPRRLNYNLGPGSWLGAHVVIYANGARSIIAIINGKWRKK
jgi:hypothetical protein